VTVNRSTIAFGAAGLAAAIMVGAPLARGISDGQTTPPTPLTSASPTPLTSASASPTPLISASPTMPPLPPKPVPTTTLRPDDATVATALANAVTAYTKMVKTNGGVSATVFTSNGYATQSQMTPKSRYMVVTGSPTIPEVRVVKKTTYLQLAGEELTKSQPLMKKAGKANAIWTTVTTPVAPILNRWLYPVNLATAVKGLSPGLVATDMFRQDDGTTVISADLYPEKVRDDNARTAFALPSPKKSTKKGTYTVQFGLDAAGVLTRMIVNIPKQATQVIVKKFEPITVTRPKGDTVLTPKNVKVALKAQKKEIKAAKKKAKAAKKK